ncbi:MAG: hypothetical protein ACYDG4_17045 [Desulfuromonadaceae bacterium]
MANIKYRISQDVANVPASTTVKGSPLTNIEVDGNFKSVQDDLALKAPIASPTFTGTPNAPTAAVGTNTTQLASTAFVVAERDATATLTNKTLTAPVISGGSIAGGTGDFTSLTASGNVTFTSTGAMLVPVGTDTQRPVGVNGLIRYNNTTQTFEGYADNVWGAIGGGGGAKGSNKNEVFWENETVVTSSYTITAGRNAGTFGPVSVAEGVVVTVPDGSVWTIV